jgi:hypothetical protein
MNSFNETGNQRSDMTQGRPIVELRQYTLHSGARDVLIDLFEREFIESQEAQGISVLGQFRDRDDPERFVWLRGFQSMEARAAARAAFYGGPTWQSHREAANATMLDSDNVLLLHPVGPHGGFTSDTMRSREVPAGLGARRVITATIHYLDANATDAFATFFETVMAPRLVSSGASILAALATEDSPNTFSRLPVREGEQVFLWFSAVPDADALERHRAALRQSDGWRERASAGVLRQLMRKAEVLTLIPTRRSRLR